MAHGTVEHRTVEFLRSSFEVPPPFRSFLIISIVAKSYGLLGEWNRSLRDKTHAAVKVRKRPPVVPLEFSDFSSRYFCFACILPFRIAVQNFFFVALVACSCNERRGWLIYTRI